METFYCPLSRIILDFILLTLVGLATPLVKKYGTISHRGFFCNDLNLMYPYIDESIIDSQFFHPFGFSVAFFLIIVVEYFWQRKSEKIVIYKFKFSTWIYNAYIVLVYFLFGVFTTILINTILKGWIGRLRPFFFADCHPNINCSLPENQNVYHYNYQCLNKQFKQNTRLSFPSGHANFAMFCAIFLSIFLYKRIKFKYLNIIKTGIVFFLISLASIIGVSRIANFKHHWDDVFAGSVLGGSCAFFVSLNLYTNVLNLEKNKTISSKI